jgi:hypothetical protein
MLLLIRMVLLQYKQMLAMPTTLKGNTPALQVRRVPALDE